MAYITKSPIHMEIEQRSSFVMDIQQQQKKNVLFMSMCKFADSFEQLHSKRHYF